jgi:predicted nucleotidyltransferase component of viral defense system
MARETRNVGASVRARLLERAHAERSDFQILLIRYAIERLLYRLSVSQHQDRFILKGAMLLATWVPNPFRPTRDLDLLGYGDPDAAAIAETFRSICTMEVNDDGVEFKTEKLVVESIRAATEYGGVRVRMPATIDRAVIAMQIDVGFGDAVTPAPVAITYPVLLNSPAPRIRAYPPETVIAEKFHAIVTNGITNSRLKDYYDLWLISRTFEFRRSVLSNAVRKTFECRGTALPVESPVGLTPAYAAAWNVQWTAFLRRERLAVAPADLVVLIEDLAVFLVASLAKDEIELLWNAKGEWLKG